MNTGTSETGRFENYTQAVEAARGGNQEAFRYLYENTYRDKWYIALKYMRNEDDAQDVLQDAYLKAWKNLSSLNEPEKFPGWLSLIVANTALNALKKKKDLPFSALEHETDEGDTLDFDKEDWRTEYRPEHAYTDKETSELLREMLDALSEEQRFCMLMYYVEERSVSEIAETIGCAKGTVTSRLNYGRKNLKAKAEEMEKRGYALYGLAPLPFLLFLLRTEAHAAEPLLPALNTAEAASFALSNSSSGAAAQGTSVKGVAEQSSSAGGATPDSGITAADTSANAGIAGTGEGSSTVAEPVEATTHAVSTTCATSAATGASAAVATTGMTIAAKIAVGVTILAVLGGGGFAVAKLLSSEQDDTTLVSEDTLPETEAVVEYVETWEDRWPEILAEHIEDYANNYILDAEWDEILYEDWDGDGLEDAICWGYVDPDNITHHGDYVAANLFGSSMKNKWHSLGWFFEKKHYILNGTLNDIDDIRTFKIITDDGIHIACSCVAINEKGERYHQGTIYAIVDGEAERIYESDYITFSNPQHNSIDAHYSARPGSGYGYLDEIDTTLIWNGEEYTGTWYWDPNKQHFVEH